MPSPVRYAVIVKMFEQAGWTYSHTRGSHHYFKKPGQRVFSVPVHHGRVDFHYVRQIEKLIRDDPPGAGGGTGDGRPGA